MHYTWLKSIDLLYAVYVVPLVSVCRLLPCFSMSSTDRLYALQVTPLSQYIVY
jgi:hypothetical protein